MKLSTAALRIGLGISGLAVALVFFAQLLDVLPDPHWADKRHHTAVCESLAVHGSLAVQQGQFDQLRAIAQAVAERNPEIVFLSLNRSSGENLLRLGDERQAAAPALGMMKATVPLAFSDAPWGTFEVVFESPQQGFWAALWHDPTMRLAGFFGTAGLLVFWAYGLLLARLATGNPRTMPDRVRDTLDAFAEGVLVVDTAHRIAFANKAFCNLAGESGTNLLGQPAGQLPWMPTDEPAEAYPWERAAQFKSRQRGLLSLESEECFSRSLSVNAIPIEGRRGEVSGTLTTFDDLTTIEEMNDRLRKLLVMLRQSRAKIRDQNKALHRLATIDPLTECLNRRAYFAHLESLIASAKRYQHSLSCLMVDVDHFKVINDRHGHAAGDDVLAQIAVVLRTFGREADVVGRYGGEEFCVALPHTDLPSAMIAAERLRQLIAQVSVGEHAVTASIGVTSLSLGASDVESLIEQADAALYAAKRGGRDCVVAFGDALRFDRA